MMSRWLQRLFSAFGAPSAGLAAVPVTASVPVPADVPEHAAVPAARQAAVTPAARALPAPVSFDQLEHVNGVWNAWLFDCSGNTVDGLELNDAESRVLAALAAILATQQSGAALVRRMPGLVPQLLQSLRSETFSGSALSRTISSDVVLVAAVIRLANNCYQAGGAITSVEHAVILIGQEGLRQLITTVAFRPIIDVNSGFYVRRLAPRLWEHAERCALSARQLAAELGVEPFDAFLAGLLHNVGMIVSLRIMDGVAKEDRRLCSDVFLAQLARDTRRLCASIAREWHFPESVVTALLEQGELRKGAAMSPLGRLLKLTDYLGKVRLLVENDLLDESDAGLFAGLAPQAVQCYSALAASREPAAAV
jgi:HD-like signal output (HDOD) protein